jgi:pseudaminic acid synthase
MNIGTFDLTGSRVFVIAELSANHNGSIESALEHVKAAKKAGADAIKLQTYTADTITIDAKTDDFRLGDGTLWAGKYLYELYQEAYTPWEWHKQIFEAAKAEGLICFSSPFDFTAVDLLADLDAPAYKIASFEITDIPLIEYTASKGKPVIISTGVANEDDIHQALDACYRVGNKQVVLLKCTSSYPAPVNEANICMIKDMAQKYGVITGLSDHTMGITVPVVAVAFGARVIEKHFIIDRSMGGPDAAFSLDTEEFTAMVKAVREAEQAIGTVDYRLTPKQQTGRDFARSLYITADVKEGDVLSKENIRSVRPGLGLHPKYYQQVLGKTFKNNYQKGTRLSLDLIQ